MNRQLALLIACVAVTASYGAVTDMERLKERLACLPQDQREVFAARFKSRIADPTLEKSKQWASEIKKERDEAVRVSNGCIADARRQEKPPRELCASEMEIVRQYDNGTAPSMRKEAIDSWFARELPGMQERTKALLDEMPQC